MFKDYWKILEGHRVTASFAVLLLGIASVLEGLALIALMPALSATLSASSRPETSGYLQHLVVWFSLPDSYIVPLGLSVFALLGVTTALFRLFGDTKMLRIRTRVEESARVQMANTLLRMQWSRYVALQVGDISKAMLIEGVQMGAGTHSFLLGLGAIIAALCYLGIAFAISVPMTLMTLLFGLFGLGAYYLASRGSRRHARELSQMMTSIGNEVNNIFGNLKFFRAAGRSRLAERQTRELSGRYGRTFFRSQILSVLMRFGFEAGAIVFIAAFLAVVLLLRGHSTALALIFLAVFYRLAPQLLKVQDCFFQAAVYLPWFHSWHKRLEEARTAEERHSGTERIQELSEIRLSAVELVYSGRESAALTSVDLKIGRGECVAIVGRSGSGKSTIVDLVSGLLAPTRGSVKVNGIDLSRIDTDFWRDRIGLVLQESPLFYGTVIDNIAWGEPEVDRSKAERAARLAHAWEFIANLPSGMDTLIGEKGGMLSGGQRQRIALARALYRDPWLLILDEATSALDSHAEAVVQEALREIKGRCAILMIAHKVKTTEIADNILVLEEGRIVQKGTWSDLSRENGPFRELMVLQGIDPGKPEAPVLDRARPTMRTNRTPTK
ncbi:hypothetical protein SVA_2050 [Sulfurifustis variabilis]|uniref:ABC transporter ATP-binding protein n=1 Tax=Sulfurifustis variabilis TaxID=1675686 RepID=A0A1B4V7L1_9GAMM|nr:ABC transporter ATP-binding protein [Sulfurifustis variabilis]BAU48602.1 hypothetical protein SVA_2050 [Sulfurifustis variabilis]